MIELEDQPDDKKPFCTPYAGEVQSEHDPGNGVHQGVLSCRKGRMERESIEESIDMGGAGNDDVLTQGDASAPHHVADNEDRGVNVYPCVDKGQVTPKSQPNQPYKPRRLPGANMGNLS